MPRGRFLLGGGLVVLGLVWAVRAGSSERLPVAEPIVVTQSWLERADTLRRNETLSALFARHAITGADLLRFLAAADVVDPRRQRAGTVYTFTYPVGEDRVERVRLRTDDSTFLVLTRSDADAWRAATEVIDWTIYTERLSGDIRVSLDRAVDRLVPDSLLPFGERREMVNALAMGVYGWTVDFTRDIYEGDAVDILYERLESSLGEVRFGRILAAVIESRGRPQRAYLFEDTDGRNAYFDEQGRSMRRAFSLYPVEYRRISSGFNRGRLHPVLRTRRPHLGVDFAANTGTPIAATGDGTVARADRWGGYGNVVVLRHPQGIETRYAHLSRFAGGIRPGVRVRQGQTIGYVGMTGLANGPHVHYEMLKNGQHVDPRRQDFGRGDPVPRARRTAFESAVAAYDRYLPHRDAAQRVD